MTYKIKEKLTRKEKKLDVARDPDDVVGGGKVCSYNLFLSVAVNFQNVHRSHLITGTVKRNLALKAKVKVVSCQLSDVKSVTNIA